MKSSHSILSWPYLIALLAGALVITPAAMGPYMTLMQLAKAVKTNDSEKLAQMLDTPALTEIAKKFIDTELDIRWKSDTQPPEKAFMSYWASKMKIDDRAKALITPGGLQNFLRGDVTKISQPDPHQAAQWIGDAHIAWQSPMQAYAELPNPENGLTTRLVMTRDGLFHWRIVAVDLPVKEILDRFSNRLESTSDRTSEQGNAEQKKGA